MGEISKNFSHYIPLFAVLLAGVVGFAIFSYDKLFQIVLSVAMAAGYVTWGIIHHKIHKDLYPEVVFEYISTAILGLVILFSVIFRA